MNPDINTYIIQPIKSYLENKVSEKEINWTGISIKASQIRKQNALSFYEVQIALKPYYLKLIAADPSFFNNRNSDTKAKSSIIELMKGEGKRFCREYNNIDIVQCAEEWGKRLMIDNHNPGVFFSLLRTMIDNGYEPDWNDIYRRTKEKLVKSKNYGDFKTHEMFCLLVGVTLIQRTNCTLEDKKGYLTLMKCHWPFLCYMYSVMINFIVGLKLDNFAAVAGTMSTRKSSYPFMHLFYKAFKENFDKLCPEGQRDKRTGELIRDMAQINLNEIEEIIKHTEQREDLNTLCEILFPKKMKDVLEQERPKTYRELEQDIDRLNISYDEMVKRLAETVKTSVSIDELNASFDKFPMELALAFFNSINSLLVQNATWQQYAPQIQQRILNRRVAANVVIQNQFGPVNGNVETQTLQIPTQMPQHNNNQIEEL